MRIAFLTLGCKFNQYETEMIKEYHLRKGDVIVNYNDTPDITYVNTCTVTGLAGHQSRNLYRRALKSSKKVRVLGCHAKLFPEEFPGAEFFDISKIEDRNTLQQRTRAYVRIQKGCDNFCTYCIVPYARGKNISFPPEKIIDEVKRKIDVGFKEVVLTGIHIGNYNYDGITISGLLERLLKLNIQIRLSSMKPDRIDKKLIDLFSLSNLAPHLHISQQSGDNKILKKMGRHYKKEDTLRIVDAIRNVRSDVNFGADFIVGFPGEDEDAFDRSVSLIKEAGISYLHIFRYSPRPFTLAAHFPDQVPDRVRKERAERLRKLGDEMSYKFRGKLVGKIYRVIPERKQDSEERLYYGFTPNYIRVLFSRDRVREVVPVRITRITMDRTYGERAE